MKKVKPQPAKLKDSRLALEDFHVEQLEERLEFEDAWIVIHIPPPPGSCPEIPPDPLPQPPPAQTE